MPIDPKHAEALAAFDEHGSLAAAARALGIARTTFSDRFHKACAAAGRTPNLERGIHRQAAAAATRQLPESQRRTVTSLERETPSSPPTPAGSPTKQPSTQKTAANTFSIAPDGNTAAATLDLRHPVSEDEVYAAFKIDRERWETAAFKCQARTVSCKDRRTDLTFDEGRITGSVQDAGRMNVQTVYNVKLDLRRRQRDRTAEYLADLRGGLAALPAVPKWRVSIIPDRCEDILEHHPVDLHFNGRQWGTLEAALDAYATAILDNTRRAGRTVRRVVIPIGHDFFNVDTLGETTTRGTPQRCLIDPRHAYALGSTRQIALGRELADRYFVTFIVVPGNHDEFSAFFLGETLRHVFADHPRIQVINPPEPTRVYQQYHCTGVGYCHGHVELEKNLPTMFVAEAPEIYVSSRYRFIYSGHLHHEITKELGPVTLRHMPSLTPPEHYAKRGYTISPRRCTSILYHPDGPDADYHHRPAPIDAA